ncbi:MAG: hypothetical protein K8W52_02465 [Deltaproteobacteria bacterium]|nr:hypothetical protein [Deltaproteobacteria bacterium]
MFKFKEVKGYDESITTRFPKPKANATFAWWIAAPPEPYALLVTQVLSVQGSNATVLFLDRKTGDVSKAATGQPMKPVKIDLDDLHVAWRDSPSTVDAPAAAGDHALLCVNVRWLEANVAATGIVAGDQVKYPYGKDLASDSLLRVAVKKLVSAGSKALTKGQSALLRKLEKR